MEISLTIIGYQSGFPGFRKFQFITQPGNSRKTRFARVIALSAPSFISLQHAEGRKRGMKQKVELDHPQIRHAVDSRTGSRRRGQLRIFLHGRGRNSNFCPILNRLPTCPGRNMSGSAFRLKFLESTQSRLWFLIVG